MTKRRTSQREAHEARARAGKTLFGRSICSALFPGEINVTINCGFATSKCESVCVYRGANGNLFVGAYDNGMNHRIVAPVMLLSLFIAVEGCGGSSTTNADASVLDAAQDASHIAADGALQDATATSDSSATADAQSADAGPTDDPMPYVSSYYGKLATLTAGGTIDWNDDGTVDTTVTVADDGTHTIVRAGHHGMPLQTIVVSSDGSIEITGDYNENGITDFHATGVSTPTDATWSETNDDDFDGAFDRGRTSVYTPTSNGGLMESRSDLAPYWFPMDHQSLLAPEQVTLKFAQEECGPPDAPAANMTTEPTDACDTAIDTALAAINPLVAHQHVNYPYPGLMLPGGAAPTIDIEIGGDSSCETDSANRISRVLPMAIRELTKGLNRWNGPENDIVALRFAQRRLVIGCTTNTVCSFGASTDTYGVNPDTGVSSKNVVRMIINTAAHSLADDIGLEEVLIHELFHFAGFVHHGDREQYGLDHVYACGRHLNFCRRGSFQSVKQLGFYNSAFDCSECAEPEFRILCGDIQTIHTNEKSCMSDPRPTSIASQCEDSGGCLVDGLSCQHTSGGYCNFTKVIPSDRRGVMDYDNAGCVLACPSGFHAGAMCAPGLQDSFATWRAAPTLSPLRCMPFHDDQHACTY